MYKIAVVDDNPAWCFTVEHFLRHQGFAVTSFNDPILFVREARHFDLALIDFSMPPRRHQKDTDGPDLIYKLKRDLAKPPLLVLISAFFTEDTLKAAHELCPDADAYLSKNIGIQELARKVEQLVSSRNGSIEPMPKRNQPIGLSNQSR